MRALLFAFLATVTLAGIGLLGNGCRQPEKSFVEAVDGAWVLIGPDYRQYVAEDVGLTADQKLIRQEHAAELSRLIEEAKRGD